MEHQRILANLRFCLASLYKDKATIERVIFDAGIESSRIRFDVSVLDCWHYILAEADKTHKIPALLGVVEGEYWENREFQKIHALYLLTTGQLNVAALDPSKERGITRRLVPDQLTFLVNRHEQEDELIEVFQKVEQRPDKPIVCLVHGDEYQCHDMFVERLRRVSLPKALGLPRDQDTFAVHLLRWPGVNDAEKLHKNLKIQLGEMICNDPHLDTEDINLALKQMRIPHLLHCHIIVEDDANANLAMVKEFLNFWQKWPSLLSGQLLFICLCIKHRRPLKGRRTRRFPWFPARFQSDPQEITMVRIMNTFSPTQFDRLICVSLPKLDDVKIDDVEHWARSEATQIFFRSHELLAEIRALYQNLKGGTPAQTMPMEDVAKELKQILNRLTIEETS